MNPRKLLWNLNPRKLKKCTLNLTHFEIWIQNLVLSEIWIQNPWSVWNLNPESLDPPPLQGPIYILGQFHPNVLFRQYKRMLCLLCKPFSEPTVKVPARSKPKLINLLISTKVSNFINPSFDDLYPITVHAFGPKRSINISSLYLDV